LVGLFTGVGALLALGVFLPLPTRFAKYKDITPGDAVRISYVIVAGVSWLVAAWCFLGLPPPRNPATGDTWQEIKTWVWTRIWGGDPIYITNGEDEGEAGSRRSKDISGVKGLWEAVKVAFEDGRIGVAYVGGFVARASSVGISLFIPLFVNHYFVSTGRCEPSIPELTKDECRKAYILASTLTGTSQLTALILAPVFGLFTDRCSAVPYLRNVPLILSSALGVLSFMLFSFLPSPESSVAFVYAALIGASQIGAIVSSLGLLSRGIVDVAGSTASPRPGESQPLLSASKRANTGREAFKGSIAGVYSLFGGAAILLLTKAGGKAFDVAPAAPFWMLAGFNGLLGVVTVGNGMYTAIRESRRV